MTISSAQVDFIMHRLDVALGCKGLVQDIVALLASGKVPGTISRREAELEVEVTNLRVAANAALGELQSLGAKGGYSYSKLSWALEPNDFADPDLDSDPDNNPYDSNGDLIHRDSNADFRAVLDDPDAPDPFSKLRHWRGA